MPGQALLLVSPEFLVGLCKAGDARRARVIRNPLPDDARYVASQSYGREIALIVESETFAPNVPEGNRPVLPLPVFEVER